MAAHKGNKYAKGNKGGGRPSVYQPKFATMAKKACDAGFTDKELADLFGIGLTTVGQWKLQHKEFSDALKTGKGESDERVERSLYHKAIGYTFDAVKIFPPRGNGKTPLVVPYREHIPPDTTACIFWLKNRRKEEWRDIQKLEHSGEDGGPILTAAVDDKARAKALLTFIAKVKAKGTDK